MEHLDQLIPFAVLGVVGVILAVLLRRMPSAPPRMNETAPEPVPAALPQLKDEEAPVARPAETSVQADKPRRKKRATQPRVATPQGPTPIEQVLDLLKRKDSLATAFLLREILDAPVSRRK